MVEICSTCDTELLPASIGWIDMFIQIDGSGNVGRFYGKFSEWKGLRGVFGWIEYPEEIPPGKFCPRGHVGFIKLGSKTGKITRR